MTTVTPAVEAGYRLAWLTSADVDADVEERIVAGLTAAMPELRMTAYFEQRRGDLRTYDHMVVATETATGALVGVLASSWRTTADGRRFLHLPLDMIAEGHRGSGLFLTMLAHHWAAVAPTPEAFPSVVALRTYNPLVHVFARSMELVPGVTVYPRTDGEPQDPAMADLATAVAGVVSPEHPFEPDVGVVRGSGVPPDLYPDLPASVGGEVFDYFARHLGPADRILCVARIDGTDAKRGVLERFARRRGSTP